MSASIFTSALLFLTVLLLSPSHLLPVYAKSHLACPSIPDCSFNGTDFSSLSSLPDFSAQTSEPDGGIYTYVVSICRPIVNSSCLASLFSATSVCQVNTNTAPINIFFGLANWIGQMPVQWSAYSGSGSGYTLRYLEPGSGKRFAVLNLLCPGSGSAAPANGDMKVEWSENLLLHTFDMGVQAVCNTESLPKVKA